LLDAGKKTCWKDLRQGKLRDFGRQIWVAPELGGRQKKGKIRILIRDNFLGQKQVSEGLQFLAFGKGFRFQRAFGGGPQIGWLNLLQGGV